MTSDKSTYISLSGLICVQEFIEALVFILHSSTFCPPGQTYKNTLTFITFVRNLCLLQQVSVNNDNDISRYSIRACLKRNKFCMSRFENWNIPPRFAVRSWSTHTTLFKKTFQHPLSSYTNVEYDSLMQAIKKTMLI